MFKLSKKTKDRIFIIEMLFVPILHFIVFWVYVKTSSILLAFQDEWTGELTLRHFERFFNEWRTDFSLDGTLKFAVTNTLIEVSIGNLISTPLNIFITFALFKKFYGHTFYRVLFYLPGIIGSVVISTMELYVLAPGGPIIKIGEMLGIDWSFNILQTGFYGNVDSARWTYFLTSVSISGGTILIQTGVLNRIPKDLFDSAKLDGVGFFKEFIKIALPLIWSTVGIMWIMNFAVGWAGYQRVLLLTGGANNTNNFGYYLVSHTLSAVTGGGCNYNYPAAIGIIMTVIIAPITLILRHFASKIVEPVEF